MSSRPSRALAMALSLFIISMMTVWAPVVAFADSPNGTPPSTPPGQSDTPPGNSAEAPGQVAKTESAASTEAAPPEAPGKSEDAPGHNKTEPAAPADTSVPPASNGGGNGNANGHSSAGSNGNGNSNAGSNGNGGGNGNNVPADNLNDGKGGGVGNSENQDKNRPNVGNGPGTGQIPAGDCTNKHQGADGSKGGANQSGPYENTCDGRPSDNGQGGGNATGRPCMGCVGNADDKNPPGQLPNGASDGNRGNGKGNGSNRGYECDDNNGVGKGNPAHTGCTPPPCPNGYTLTVSATFLNGATGSTSPSIGTHSNLTSAVSPVTATAGTDGSVASPTSQPVTYTNCSGVANVTFTKTNCPNGFTLTVASTSVNGGTGTTSPGVGPHRYDNNPVTRVTATGTNGSTASPPSQTVTYSNCVGSAHVTFSKGSQCEVNCGSVDDCDNDGIPDEDDLDMSTCRQIVDCDKDGVDDNFDDDISTCAPPLEDCDGDGVDDNFDTDLSECDETERPEFCPGTATPMPEDGICDEVLGEIINRDPKPVFPPLVAGEVLGKPEAKPAVAASVLPFTGGNMLPFLIVSLALMGVGGASLRRRADGTDEELEAA